MNKLSEVQRQESTENIEMEDIRSLEKIVDVSMDKSHECDLESRNIPVFKDKSYKESIMAKTRILKEKPYRPLFSNKQLVSGEDFRERVNQVKNQTVMPDTHLWFNSLIKDISAMERLKRVQKSLNDGDLTCVLKDNEIVTVDGKIVTQAEPCCSSYGVYDIADHECCWIYYRRMMFIESIVDEAQTRGWLIREYETEYVEPTICKVPRCCTGSLCPACVGHLYTTVSITENAYIWQYKTRLVVVADRCYIDSMTRLFDHKGTRDDVWMCKDLIAQYNMDCEHILVMLFMIHNRPYIKLDHHMYAAENLWDCDPIIIHQTPDFILLRSGNGYQAYGIDDGSLLKTIEDMPYQKNNKITYDTTYEVCDKEDFLRAVAKDLTILGDKSSYHKLMYCLKCHYEVKKVKSYLNISHFLNFEERPATRCVVLSGKSGKGKSHVVSEYCRGKSVYYYRHDPTTKNFFSGYIGQDVVVIDDIAHYSKEEWLIIMQLISTTPVYLPMADMRYIGMIPFVSSTILITTNCLEKIQQFALETRHALGRRMEIIEYDNSCSYNLYKRSIGRFVRICRFDRRNIQDFLTRYDQERIRVVGQLDMGNLLETGMRIGNLLFCTGIPYLGLVGRLFSEIRKYVHVTYGCVTQIMGGLVDCGVEYDHNWIPRHLRKMVDKLDATMKKLVREKIRLCYTYHNGPRCDNQKAEDLVFAAAEGNILSNDVVYGNTDLEWGGKLYKAPDLKPYAIPVRQVITCEKQARNEQLTDYEMQSLPDMYEIFPDKCIKKPYQLFNIERKGYVLRNLPSELKQWYKEEEFFEEFAPLNDTLVTVVDEREWKPNFNVTTHIKRSKINELLQATQRVSKTLKRRMQRKTQRAKL